MIVRKANDYAESKDPCVLFDLSGFRWFTSPVETPEKQIPFTTLRIGMIRGKLTTPTPKA
jgi:hypothetical protein